MSAVGEPPPLSSKGMIDLDTWLRTPMGVTSLRQCGCHYDGTHIIIDEMAQYERMLEINKEMEYYNEQYRFIEDSLREAREYFKENEKAVNDLKQTMLQSEMQTAQLEIDKVKRELNAAEAIYEQTHPNRTMPPLLPVVP